MTATEYPHLAESGLLLVSGGLTSPKPDSDSLVPKVFGMKLSEEEHLAGTEQAFFAAGDDASVWSSSRQGSVASHQELAVAKQTV